MATSIRVLIADDQDLVRAGLRLILESELGIDVVGEAVDGAQALAAALELQPDVVCMDVQMPGMDGLVATREIIARGDNVHVLILTTFDRDDYLFQALQAGASGFLLKTASPELLVDAVKVVSQGDALLAPEVTRRVIERFMVTPPPSRSEDAAADLTGRERDVLELVAQGWSNSEIAARLYLGEATVKTHVSHVLLKLGLRDRVRLVVWAYEHGIVIPNR